MENKLFKCRYCNKFLSIENFYFWIYSEEEMELSVSKRRRKTRRSDFCRLCSVKSQQTDKRRKQQRDYLYNLKNKDLLLYWSKRKVIDLRRRAKQLNVNFDLTSEFLYSLWVQNSNCYYTNEEMTLLDNLRNHVSVDRLVPSLGYIQSNVVLCSFWVNACKQELTNVQFYDFCQTILDVAKVKM